MCKAKGRGLYAEGLRLGCGIQRVSVGLRGKFDCGECDSLGEWGSYLGRAWLLTGAILFVDRFSFLGFPQVPCVSKEMACFPSGCADLLVGYLKDRFSLFIAQAKF